MAERVYRPDLYRAAVAELGIAVPESDYKEEGGSGEPAPFFSERGFDPRAALRYLKGLPIRASAADLDAFAARNG